MEPSPMIWVAGTIVQGHRIASGLAGDPAFPLGTIRPQLDAFRAAIPDFDDYLGGPPFAGTVNVKLDTDTMVKPGPPHHRVGPVRWTERFPPEMFLLSRAMLQHGRVRHPVWLYIPDPATKPGHHQPSNVVELLAPFLAGLNYGTSVSLGHAAGLLIP